MGGHALKNTSVCRVNLETLNKVKEDIKQKVSTDIKIEYFRCRLLLNGVPNINVVDVQGLGNGYDRNDDDCN